MSPRLKRLAPVKHSFIDGLFTRTVSRFKDPESGLVGIGESENVTVNKKEFDRFLKDLTRLTALRKALGQLPVSRGEKERARLARRLADARESFRARYERALDSLYFVDRPHFLNREYLFVNAGLFRKADRHYLWRLVNVLSDSERQLRDNFMPPHKKGSSAGSRTLSPSQIKKVLRLGKRGKRPSEIVAAIRRDVGAVEFESVRRQVERVLRSYA